MPDAQCLMPFHAIEESLLKKNGQKKTALVHQGSSKFRIGQINNRYSCD
jgi:hypothetical protein